MGTRKRLNTSKIKENEKPVPWSWNGLETGGGERGIRTPGGVTLNSFQDCRDRPLCHFSAAKVAITRISQKKLKHYPKIILSDKLVVRYPEPKKVERWCNYNLAVCKRINKTLRLFLRLHLTAVILFTVPLHSCLLNFSLSGQYFFS